MPRTITGVVTYRTRIALPPDAVLHVRLEDVSLPDDGARAIARTSVATEGRQVPIPFTLDIDPEAIQQSHHYRVVASIDVGDIALFVSRHDHPVLTHGAGDVANIEVEQALAGGGPPSASAPAARALEGTRWTLVQLLGQPVIDVPGKRAVAITFEVKDDAVSGSTGVNSFSGAWSHDGERLMINPGAMTMMAGPEPLMEQEATFIRALKNVKSWRISGENLELLDEQQVILTFEADDSGPVGPR